MTYDNDSLLCALNKRAGEIEVPGFKPKPVPPVTAVNRVWAEIPPDMMKAYEGKYFGMQIRSGEGSSVVIRFARINTVLSVMDVRPNTAASRVGLRQGDVIVAVNGRPLPADDPDCASPRPTWAHPTWGRTISSTPPYALVLQSPRRNLYITGLQTGQDASR
jgi:hypothetical protein